MKSKLLVIGVITISIAAILISMNTYSYTDMSHHDDSYFNPVNVGATKERLAYVQAMCAGEIELIPQTIFRNDTHKFSSDNCEWKIYEKRDVQPDDEFEKTWGGPGNRHPAFLGYEIPEICTFDMIKHLVKHSNMFFDDEENFSFEWIGLPVGVNADDFDICYDELLELRGERLPELKKVLDNCTCLESGGDCYMEEYQWNNSTHHMDNILCEWQEIENEN